VVLKLGELSSDAAAEFLQKRAHRTDVAGAVSLAKALGFLPLALDHAGAYCRLTGSSFNTYHGKIDERIMRAPKGVAYPASVAATFGLAAEQAASECAEATEALGFFSYLATERIPADLIYAAIADEEARAEALMALAAVSLIEYVALDDGAQGVTLHRLVQAAMRAVLAERGFAATFIGRATTRLTEVFPKDALGDPTVWSRTPGCHTSARRVREPIAGYRALRGGGGTLSRGAHNLRKDARWHPSGSCWLAQ
jgi:hypothetical protein